MSAIVPVAKHAGFWSWLLAPVAPAPYKGLAEFVGVVALAATGAYAINKKYG